MDKIYDLIIVGAGPAGLAAGVYGARAKMKTLILEKGTIGGMASKTTEIVNYPGIPKTSGEKLGEVMSKHAEKLGATIVRDSIRTVELNGEIKILKSRRKEYKARSVIFATGTRPRVLGIPGEIDFKGRGVAYCATCDAEFFSNQEVVVVGSGDQAIEEGMFISKYASKVKVIVLHDEGVLDCNRLSTEE
ncbi:FAD-dependent oxidoreductase, partial [Cetobacterium sp.]|uniref:FAD-dependent oxidoreductase n=1 Tax=Cetobacterium sp. TaxID=2071632 RepID=UPI003EE5E99D